MAKPFHCREAVVKNRERCHTLLGALMSSIYVLEPKTRGHVVVNTTHGPIEIHLWSDEAPKSCRNFLQLCMDGFYDELPFHRVIPDVLVQTGDPSRTGTGGQSAFGDCDRGFPREAHGRLKFRRRGMCALVADDKGYVRSQFFITLAPTSWNDSLHSIFGTVQGDTIYNVLEMAAGGEVDGFDVPGGPRVVSVEIVDNPFDDLLPRASAKPALKNGDAELRAARLTTAKKAVRNKTLLSFGGGNDDDDSGSEDGRANGRSSSELPKPAKRPRRSIANGSGEAGITKFAKPSTSIPPQRGAPSAGGVPNSSSVAANANAQYAQLMVDMMKGSAAPGHAAGATGSASIAVQLPESPPPEMTEFRANAEKKARQKESEAETLRRLRIFEDKLLVGRREARADPTKRAATQESSPWFSKGLHLPLENLGLDDEVEVAERLDKKNGRKRDRRRF